MRRLRLLQLILAFSIPVLLFAGSSTAVPPEVVAQFEPGIIEVENDGRTTEIPYRIRRPKDLTTDEPVPLVIFMHGAGSRGNDNQKQLGRANTLDLGTIFAVSRATWPQHLAAYH